ncbi:MAG TPA: S-methyl-5'-thioadenosine phosphorylase [Spirochaetota bacterium]|nr:S-methyl-5'-thioadenosine phosphorylase [Spirochaetota bacterium]HOM09486.1 S-methyl-5'-thioadenosine phosphorylase [Spirochaetota bacterium]HPP48597.1 S-methyl-5'-thioadenosine phosphorylase [Spirochaetota bacterium]
MKPKIDVGIIGGSGLYQIEGVTILEEVKVRTPWGMPSDAITIAEVGGVKAGFLPRHGRGHFILPHEINYRANIASLKMLGAGQIVAFSAVGSLKERIKPLDFVIPNQIIDRTKSRISTFFGDGIAAHIAFADPFCTRLHELILVAAQKLNIPMHTNETLVCMEGPAFSTRAESHLYRSWQAGVINMSTLPEAKLAREAEMCYAVICMSTDYDCWKEDEEHVTVDMVVNNLNKNASNAKALIKELIPLLTKERDCGCKEAIKYAIITDPKKQSSKQKKKLKAILPNYFS